MNREQYLFGGVILLGLIYILISSLEPFYPLLRFENVYETLSIPIYPIPYPFLEEWVGIDGILNWKKAVAQKPGFSSEAVLISYLLLSLGLGSIHVSGLKMKTWPSLISLGLIILFFGTIPYEEIDLQNAASRWPVILVLLVGSLTFLLRNRLANHTLPGFLFLSIFYGLTFFLIQELSGADQPAFFLLQLATPGMLISALLLLILVAHEPLHLFARLTSRKGSLRSNGFIHFSLFTLLYLGNLLLYHLSTNTALITGFDLIDPAYFLLLSGIIGFFLFDFLAGGFGVWHDDSGPRMFFSGLALIAISFYSWAVQNFNDAYLDVISDLSLFTMLGVGFLFAIYIGVNFGNIYGSRVAFEAVLLKGRTFPLFMVWVGGLTIVILLVLRSGKFQLYQAQGAYYTALADAYSQEGEDKFAKIFHERSAGFAYRNHKALYSLAWGELQKNKPRQALIYIEQAIQKEAYEEDYILAAEIYGRSDAPFDENFRLREGLSQSQGSAPITVNLGLSHFSMGLIDSAAYYFMQAGEPGTENLKAMEIKSKRVFVQDLPGFQPSNANDWLQAFYGREVPPEAYETENLTFPAYYNQSLFGALKEDRYPLAFPDTLQKNDPLNRANLDLVYALKYIRESRFDSASYRITKANQRSGDAYFMNFAARAFLSFGAYHWVADWILKLREKGNLDLEEAYLFCLIEQGKMEEAEKYYIDLARTANDERSARLSDPDLQAGFRIFSNENQDPYLLLSDVKDQEKRNRVAIWLIREMEPETALEFLNSISIPQTVGIELIDELLLQYLRSADTIGFLEAFPGQEFESGLLHLGNSISRQKENKPEAALTEARLAYARKPWIDEVVIQLNTCLLDVDSIGLAYDLMLNHVGNFGRSPKTSIALAVTSLYYGLEENLKTELAYLENHLGSGEYKEAEASLEQLKMELRNWDENR